MSARPPRGPHASVSEANGARRRFLRGLAASAGVIAVGAPAAACAREQIGGDETILEEAQSRFNNIRVGQRGSLRTMYFVGDNGVQYIESRYDVSRPQSLDLDYSRTMMAGFLGKVDLAMTWRSRT